MLIYLQCSKTELLRNFHFCIARKSASGRSLTWRDLSSQFPKRMPHSCLISSIHARQSISLVARPWPQVKASSRCMRLTWRKRLGQERQQKTQLSRPLAPNHSSKLIRRATVSIFTPSLGWSPCRESIQVLEFATQIYTNSAPNLRNGPELTTITVFNWMGARTLPSQCAARRFLSLVDRTIHKRSWIVSLCMISRRATGMLTLRSTKELRRILYRPS